MQEDDPFTATYREAEELIRAARPDQIAEALRLLACRVAHAERYHESLPLEELIARIAGAPKDAASIELVAVGMAHLVEVLRRLHVTRSESISCNTPTLGWGD